MLRFVAVCRLTFDHADPAFGKGPHTDAYAVTEEIADRARFSVDDLRDPLEQSGIHPPHPVLRSLSMVMIVLFVCRPSRCGFPEVTPRPMGVSSTRRCL
jgi:hypothetical protein